MRVHTVPTGQPTPSLPDFVTQLLTALDSYDSPIDIRQAASTYGVTPTSLSAFVHSFVLASGHGIGV